MAKVMDKKVALSSEELHMLGEGKEYELIPNQKGVFLLIEKQMIAKNEGKQVCVSVPHHEELNPFEDEKQCVLDLVKNGKLSELVEGKFEEKLNEKQKKALAELIKEEEVFIFKLNESYKKGVYRLKETEEENSSRNKKESENYNAPEKAGEEYSIESDGFLIAKNTDKARAISYEFEGQIKEGLLKGIRTFEGTYYLLDCELLKSGIEKIAKAFDGKKALSLDELAQKINYSKLLTKIICEFLKEEGEVLEKRKEQYAYIK